MIILFIILGLTFSINTLNLIKINKEIKHIIENQIKHQEILNKLEEKRKNFKELQLEVERIKQREIIENQLQKIETISINPIGFKTSTVGELISYVNDVYKHNGVSLCYNDILKE
jgi:hypothetical protein